MHGGAMNKFYGTQSRPLIKLFLIQIIQNTFERLRLRGTAVIKFLSTKKGSLLQIQGKKVKNRHCGSTTPGHRTLSDISGFHLV